MVEKVASFFFRGFILLFLIVGSFFSWIPNVAYSAVLLDQYSGDVQVSNWVFGSVDGTREGLRTAQSFLTTDNWTVTGVAVQLAKQGSPSDNAKIGIQADSGGSPSNTYLCSKEVTPASLGTTASRSDLTFDTTCELTTGTTYWIVYTRVTEGNISGANNYINGSPNTSSTYSDGIPKVYKSGSWVTDGVGDFYFEIEGSVTGEEPPPDPDPEETNDLTGHDKLLMYCVLLFFITLHCWRYVFGASKDL